MDTFTLTMSNQSLAVLARIDDYILTLKPDGQLIVISSVIDTDSE